MKGKVFTIAGIVAYCVLTAVFIGFRPEHLLIALFFGALFFINTKSRKFIVGLLPLIIFGISYDWLRVFPNYKVNPIDVEGLYNLEKSLFGIVENGIRLIPSEYFALHHHAVVDFLAGISYLGWVPIPVAFAIYLYVKNRKDLFLRFSMVFLFVNLIGFTGYYIHPAAPPWYAMNYGFNPVLNTPGNTGGLFRFDDLIGLPVFHSIYGRNANVFAAVPSLHSAYLVVVLFYAIKNKSHWAILVTVALFMCGIWFTAVYAAHHYIVDVLLGILCAFIGIFLFEYGLMKWACFRNFFNKYLNYIQ
ncbi:aureobasidin A resistance protein [Bacteroidia bacterium]|nr:aureobasidin A resistance protein [Bacteroidia bacterium]GHT04160.1 aureobasidin A resistance protein [Bacteroidia bacterium]GHT50409.1 aureobasidin A resistance protein [Bacteroidia bacterium]